MLAIGVLAACSDRPNLSGEDLELIRSACADAAAACRTQPPDEEVLSALPGFADAATACAHALGSEEEAGGQWLRFLFADADLEVRRESGIWHVRTNGHATSSKLLDDALAELLHFPNARIGALTVQILSWHLRRQ